MRLQVFKEGGRLQLPGKQPLNMRFLEFFVLLMEKGPPSSPPHKGSYYAASAGSRVRGPSDSWRWPALVPCGSPGPG